MRKRRYRYMTLDRVQTSLFDLLPFDIQLNMFKQKHELEFKQVLNIIDELQLVATRRNSCNVYFDMSLSKTLSSVCNIHVRNGLLTPISTKNNVLRGLESYHVGAIFTHHVK